MSRNLTEQQISINLSEPIPDLSNLRERKKDGYGRIPIEASSDDIDPLVGIYRFGLAGQNYYSRPNATINEALPGVPMQPHMRESLAIALHGINQRLGNAAVTHFFGDEVELYVEDGLRTTGLQQRLFDTEIPSLLLRNDPELTQTEIDERKRQIIAAPSKDPSKPSPHSTGAAVDVILRYKQVSPTFVPNTNVWIGHRDGDTAKTIDPDYYESHTLESRADATARRNRRAFYALMTGSAFDAPTGLAVNPTEIWHWSRGDQLWALTTGALKAFYGSVEN